MAWKIDRDYLDAGTDDSQVGRASLGPELEGPTFGFRCLDDDQEVYYHGIADATAALDEEDDTIVMHAGYPPGGPAHGSLYEANRWAEAFAGALWLEVKVADAIKFGLSNREYADKLN